MTLRIHNWEFDHVSYDPDADVLYLSIGEPQPGVGEETPEGHIARYDAAGQLIGLTLVDVRDTIDGGEDIRITLPSEALISGRDLEPALA